MNKLLIALLGFAVGGALVLGPAFAFERTTSSSGTPTPMPAMGAGMMGGAVGTAGAPVRLTIVHVQTGCHVWSDGKRQAASMRLSLRRGARLAILDRDIDAHQLVQLSGPRLSLGGPMMMNHGTTVVFRQAGVYRLTTRTIEMPGMPEIKTIGPDNTLRLTVKVA